MSNPEYVFLEIERSDLPDLLRGRFRQRARPFRHELLRSLSLGQILVLWEARAVRPSIIAVQPGEREELYSWIFTFARDLAPLTSWCHVVSYADVAGLTTKYRREADLGGFEAAWASAIIAESMVLSGRTFDAISLSTCLATDGFAVGRMAALYGARVAARDAPPQLAALRNHFSKDSIRTGYLPGRAVDVLLRLLPDPPSSHVGGAELLVEASRALNASQAGSQDEGLPDEIITRFERRSGDLAVLRRLQDISAEDRVRLLREMRVWTQSADSEDVQRLLTFAAGYVLSRVGGAERDLRLAESFGEASADVLTWAAVIGSLGAAAHWTDAFSGLGRLVARELSRPLYAADPPTADISADELSVIESQRGAAKREFRPSSRNAAAISLKPGIVIQIGLSEDDRVRGMATDSGVPNISQTNNKPHGLEPKLLQAIAEQLRPYIRDLVSEEVNKSQTSIPKRGSRRTGSPQLPLKR